MELSFLQSYWWLLVSVLGAILVFLLFVQGGQSMLHDAKNADCRKLMINSLGRKWELTFTTLVVFGGAFFASFPLFYSTSFGGAYWLWMLILVSFVVQAVSYEFRSKSGNLYTQRTYDTFLMFNGLVGCVLLGVVVGTLFFGAPFTVTKSNLVAGSSPIISQWSSLHGLESIANWRCLLLGFAVFFLARTQAALYFINNIDDARGFGVATRVKVLANGLVFTVLFVIFLVVLMLAPGLHYDAQGNFTTVENIYWHNLLQMWWCIPILLIGVVLVLYGILRTALSSKWRCGIWYSGIGTVLVVLVLFFLAGYNSTAYLRSIIDPDSSLTIANSSSSHFTLTVMSWVSLVIPFVLAYIALVWRKMNNVPLTIEEVNNDSHSY
jgi:cytochrome d ubiquinol oxidase subunit II